MPFLVGVLVLAGLAVTLLFVIGSDPAERTFYVSPNGDDSADGRSERRPWRTVARANEEDLRPGDRLLLAGGATHHGALRLDPADGGQPERPVIIGSYGTGRARISPDGRDGVAVVNTGGVEVRDLVILGDPVAFHTKSGVSLFADAPDGVRFSGVTVSNVDVSRFRVGISVGGTHGSGFRDVAISASDLYDNLEAGLVTYGPVFDVNRPTYAHERVTVSDVKAYRNLGDPDNQVRNTGSGIIIGSVDTGIVERTAAYGNGAYAVAEEGPVGIWAYDSRQLLISHSLSYENRSGTTADGGGFDFDQNVSESMIEYCLSYGNDGPGYLLYSALDNRAHTGNVIRFNISVDDGRHSGRYGGITLSGMVSDSHVYHNTVVMIGEGHRHPPALRVEPGLSGVTVRNNILRVTGLGPAAATGVEFGSDELLLQGNAYVTVGAPWLVHWGHSVYPSLPAWRAATGQELLDDSPVGMTEDPWPTTPAVPDVRDAADLEGVTSLLLTPTSPVIGQALPLERLFGIDVGGTDFWSTPAAGETPSIGAHQPPGPA